MHLRNKNAKDHREPPEVGARRGTDSPSKPMDDANPGVINKLTLGSQPLQLGDNTFLLFKPPSLWLI